MNVTGLMLDPAKERDRLRSQASQRRYRARKKQKDTRLLAAVAELWSEIAQLEQARLPRGVATFTGVSRIGRDFYKHFEFGLHVPTHEQQRQFAYSMTSSSLVFMGEPNGLAMMFKQLALYASVFPMCHQVCESAETCAVTDDDIVVKCRVRLHLRLSRKSVATIYPSLLANEPLVQRLIGQTLVVPVVSYFYVDKASSTVHNIEVDADIVAAAINLLGSVEVAAVALSASKLLASGPIQPS
ncbi:hypothetical protein SPRG_08011 [Saprolegnia parasitica CBS 223.65]|uniref:BZIP domain-containing protein n=1 Tax=Saprolegnia parasitica (strain CBS 223.65) TaxID=695850 RepID=A0A067CII3_SAPPC|nr:hypothetical protein SPRG_08011 [Saprolegnia parasitica CBS 223.65]KDO26607.1 hypothetical protein SPRG_08011 [Saprolegnia parasitica CBS 223.65]|eukprot:XP_012202749.1 hypothetical protein SPRG_08011 [Saprolegnia parasitica CBS 223.65]